MIQSVLQCPEFDPTKLIMPAEGLLKGWRKTLKLTAPSGEKVTITTGEGPMFEESESFGSESESESFESESEFETESSQSPRSLKNPLSLVSSSEVVNKRVPSNPPSFDVIFSEFNIMNSFAYSSCHSLSSHDEYCFTNNDDKDIIKAMEEHENKTSIIEYTETVDISQDPTNKKEVKIGLTLISEERAELIQL